MNAEVFYDRLNAALDELLPADLDRDLTVDDIVLVRGAFARIFSDALGDAHEAAVSELLVAAREAVEHA